MSWPLVELGKVAQINPKLPQDIDETQDVSFLAMASVSEDGVILDQETRTLSETKKGFTYFERNDVLLAKITPCFENGKAVLLHNLNNQFGFGSTEFHVLRPLKDHLDENYLFYMVWNDRFRFFGEKSMKGAAGQKRISADFLKEFKISLPPLNEQKRIAAILDKADNLRRKRQQAIQLADQFLRCLFLDMFGDPVTNPKGWAKQTIESVTTKAKSWNPRSESGVTFEYIDLSSVDNNKKEITATSQIESDAAPSRARQLVGSGDVLISTVRPNLNGVAKVLAGSDHLTASTGYCVLRPKSNFITQNFLFFLVTSESFVRDMVKKATGANYPAVSDTIIKNYEFELPPAHLLEEFDSICGKTTRLKCDAKNFSKEKLFESLSQKAFAGKL